MASSSSLLKFFSGTNYSKYPFSHYNPLQSETFAAVAGRHWRNQRGTPIPAAEALSWMREKKAPMFVVATANDVSQLPPELLRAGRWDQMFFVDLPNQAEREAIWTIQIRKHGRNPSDFDTVQLARASDGLTGSEIEAVFVESLYDGFDRDTEPTDLDIARALTNFVPLSKTMAEQIGALRTWATGRARFATSAAGMERGLRKLAA